MFGIIYFVSPSGRPILEVESYNLKYDAFEISGAVKVFEENALVSLRIVTLTRNTLFGIVHYGNMLRVNGACKHGTD